MGQQSERRRVPYSSRRGAVDCPAERPLHPQARQRRGSRLRQASHELGPEICRPVAPQQVGRPEPILDARRACQPEGIDSQRRDDRQQPRKLGRARHGQNQIDARPGGGRQHLRGRAELQPERRPIGAAVSPVAVDPPHHRLAPAAVEHASAQHLAVDRSQMLTHVRRARVVPGQLGHHARPVHRALGRLQEQPVQADNVYVRWPN
mmetsp:Transcript_9404/g.30120  ORF Transcript_9404/g.30120 Transcript_9404/m.30120 type:complete len:206 (-) Transcript_9404:135-752(-)